MHGPVAAKARHHPESVLDQPHVGMPVSPHVHVRSHMSRDTNVGERRCADSRELGELLEHLGLAVVGGIGLVKDRDHEPFRLPLDQEAGVEVEGEWHPLPREGGGGDGRVEPHRPDRQVHPERAQKVAAPVAGACDHTLGLDDIRTAEAPA